jgi:hypothetical protein
MIYYTRHSEMATHHYVCLDVSSDETADSMIYDTCHSEMAAHRYVSTDVSSVSAAQWTSYYRGCSNTGTPLEGQRESPVE